MRQVLIVLMALLVTLDAASLPTLVAAHARTREPVRSCSCCGVCRCRGCRQHHPLGAPPPASGCVIEDAGCGGGGPNAVPAPTLTPYAVPEVAFAPAPCRVTFRSGATAGEPVWVAGPIPEPPPRRAAA